MATSAFDTNAFAREMTRVFGEYNQLNRRSLPELLRKRAISLAVGSGKRGKYGGLYQEARKLRPQVRREIKALPKQLGYRIKRPYGTVSAEIARRIVQAGYFQASGWIVPGLTDTGGEGSKVKTIRGEVVFSGKGTLARVDLINTSPNALEFGERTGYIARAFYNQTQDMLEYIQQHLDLTVAEFARRFPNFRQPIFNFIPD